MDYKITKDNVFLAKCVMYERRENDFLVRKPLELNEEYRIILYFRGRAIDFDLADDLPVLPYDKVKQEVNGTIEANTYYIEEVYDYTQLTDHEIEYIPTLLSRYQEKKLAEKDKRLLKFPKEILN